MSHQGKDGRCRFTSSSGGGGLLLEGGTNGLQRRETPGAERELKRVQAKVGELTMKLEIVEWFLEKKGYGEELRKLKRSGEL